MRLAVNLILSLSILYCVDITGNVYPVRKSSSILFRPADSIQAMIDSTMMKIAVANRCGVTAKIVDKKGQAYYFGYDARKGKPIKNHTGTIDIGSITKMFTATAIHQLIEQGKLNLDTRLTEILPNPNLYNGLLVINGKDYIDSVRIRHLLSHSSGFGDYFYGDDAVVIANFADSSLRFTPRQLVNMSKRVDTAKFKPGAGFSYSNVNYLFLGLIIEKTTLKSYQQYINDNILSPAGMKNTWFASISSPKDRTPGFYRNKQVQMPATLAGAAGEMVSTMDDMTLFIRHWYAGQFFKRKSTMEVIRQDNFQSMGLPIVQYGLGLIKIDEKSFGHGGQTFGFQTYAASLSNGFSFVFAIDDASVGSWEVAMKLTSYLSHSK